MMKFPIVKRCYRVCFFFFFSSRRRHTRFDCDWSSDVCSSDLLLEGVMEREAFAPMSLGYPSGHAAVAWAITIIVIAYLGRPWQIAAGVLAIIVPFYRMYVAAHLPLDLLGGAALGVTVASLVNLLLLRPAEDQTSEAGVVDSHAGGPEA